jgi:hypothetical protein
MEPFLGFLFDLLILNFFPPHPSAKKSMAKNDLTEVWIIQAWTYLEFLGARVRELA